MVSDAPDPDVELARARVDDAVSARRGRRRERELLSAESRFVEILAGLAATGATVAVTTRSGRRIRGSIAAVGHDVIVVATAAQQITVRTGCVSSVEQPDARVVGGDPGSVSDLHLVDVLCELADGETEVGVVAGDGARIDGVIESIGADVVVLRPVGRPAPVTYVALDSLSEVWSPSTSA